MIEERFITTGIQILVGVGMAVGGYIFNSIRLSVVELNANLKDSVSQLNANLKQSNCIMQDIEKKLENVNTRLTTVEKQVSDLYNFKNDTAGRVTKIEAYQEFNSK